VLSPTLYAIFTAVIPKPDGTKIALYANDTAILTRSGSPEVATQRVQSAVESLEIWFRLWRIDVNPEKSRAILLGMGRFAAADSPPAVSPLGQFAAAVAPLGQILPER
jgi:hypothetical protein